MQCTASLVTEVFDQYIIARLGIIAARFKCKIDSVNKNIDWKQSLLNFCFRNIFCDIQRLTSILKANIQAAIQLQLNEIEAQLFSLMGEFQQKLLDEASTLDPAQLQMLASKDLLALKLNLSAKELKWFQAMIASEWSICFKLLHRRALTCQPNQVCLYPKILFVRLLPKFPIDGLVLLAVNTTIDPCNKDKSKVNKECLRYDLGKFPLKPGSHDGSWSKETCVVTGQDGCLYQ